MKKCRECGEENVERNDVILADKYAFQCTKCGSFTWNTDDGTVRGKVVVDESKYQESKK